MHIAGTKGSDAPLKPANDDRALWGRLASYAKRGIESPETLTLFEIRQLAFALSILVDPDRHSERTGAPAACFGPIGAWSTAVLSDLTQRGNIHFAASTPRKIFRLSTTIER